MQALDRLIERSRGNPQRIVLAEGDDSRVVEAAGQSVREGIAKVTLLGPEPSIREMIKERGLDALSLAIIDPDTSDRLEDYAQSYYELRRHKGVSLEQARETVRQPLYFANMMVRSGHADGSVAGARNTTADTVRSAIQVIGLKEGYSLVSSFFIILLCQPFHELKGTLIFADCGLVVDPSAAELAEIAMASAESARTLLELEPRVVMLSFSTSRSAQHAHVDKVIEAAIIAKEKRPDLAIEGDMQVDAALVPIISERKAPGSQVGGRGNVLIFPNLMAGNIGYKLVERMGAAQAIGPILQGLKKPANDLSRGCSPDDVFKAIAVTAVQAQAR